MFLLTKLYCPESCHIPLQFTPNFPFTTTIWIWFYMEDNHTNCLAISVLGKDKRSLSMASNYQMRDNAATRLMLKSSTAEIEATCGYQLCSKILSHVGRAQRNAQKLGMCDAWGLDLIPCRKMLKALARGLDSVHGTWDSFTQLGICEKKILALWL